MRTTSSSGGSSSLSDRLAARAERVTARASSPGPALTDGTTNTITSWRTSSSIGRRPSRSGWRHPASLPGGPPTRRRPFPPHVAVDPVADLHGAARDDEGRTRHGSLDSKPCAQPLAAVLDNVFSPFAGNAPTAPPADSPLSWMLLGASRRQIGVESLTSQALVSSSSISYNAVITLLLPEDNGVINGSINASTKSSTETRCPTP